MVLRSLKVVVEQYVDNLNYEANDSATECRLYIAAIKELAIRRATHTGIDGNNVSFSEKALQLALLDAQRWLAQKTAGSASNAQYYDHTDIRGG